MANRYKVVESKYFVLALFPLYWQSSQFLERFFRIPPEGGHRYPGIQGSMANVALEASRRESPPKSPWAGEKPRFESNGIQEVQDVPR